jgi:periodic tryptophan protein 1
MITAATWVPRGHAAQFPTKYVFDGDEYERIAKLAKLQLDDAQEELDEARAKEKTKEKSKEKIEEEPEEGSTNGDNGVAQVQSTE